jgi:hypothetical protein
MLKVGQLNPMVRMQAARSTQRPPSGLSKLGLDRPSLAGGLMAVVMSAVMLVTFESLTLFRHVVSIGIASLLGGAFMGTAMGWYWSYTKRGGNPPAL